MRGLLLWLGALFCGIGVALMAASAIMSHMGLDPSYNLGDPTKFEFVLVPFWQVGLGMVALGGVCLLAWRGVKSAP